jgi:hypothetical protein
MQRVSTMRVDQRLRPYCRISSAPNSTVAMGPSRSSPCRAPLTNTWGNDGAPQPMRMTCCWQASAPHEPCVPSPYMLSMVDKLQMREFKSQTLRIRLMSFLYEPSRA